MLLLDVSPGPPTSSSVIPFVLVLITVLAFAFVLLGVVAVVVTLWMRKKQSMKQSEPVISVENFPAKE